MVAPATLQVLSAILRCGRDVLRVAGMGYSSEHVRELAVSIPSSAPLKHKIQYCLGKSSPATCNS